MIATLLQKEIEKLAPMPASLTRLASVISDPNSSVADVVTVVEFDQALTANILRLANSSWSASPTPVDTVRAAVLRLGGGRVFELAVGNQVAGPMSKSCPAYDLGEYELWRHSVASALAAEHLAEFATVRVSSAAFTAALLHDIGKLLINRTVGANVAEQITKTAETKHVTYIEAERLVLGTDHAEAGAAIARHWRFPSDIVNAIEHHHDPDQTVHRVLDAVHIANAVAKLIGVGLGSEQMNMKASSQAAARLGLSSGGLESLCATVRTELARTEALWKIGG
jgi:putative nucleotidyltransferase with HDIG domain